MIKTDNLETMNDDLDMKYGKIGTPSRNEFDAKSKAWYDQECRNQSPSSNNTEE